MLRRDPKRSVRLVRSTSPGGFHSRSPLPETDMSHTLRRMAVPLENASCGRQRSVNTAWARPLPVERAAAATCLLISASPDFFRRSIREAIKKGISTMETTQTVWTKGDDDTIQPSRRRRSNAIGARLRRRMSKIFQRDKMESGFFRRTLSVPGTSGRNHRRICQSPRIQRRRRLTSAP